MTGRRVFMDGSKRRDYAFASTLGAISLLVWTASRASARDLPYGGSSLLIGRSEEHTSELQSRLHLVCRLLLEKKKRGKDDGRGEDDGRQHGVQPGEDAHLFENAFGQEVGVETDHGDNHMKQGKRYVCAIVLYA